MEHQLFVIKTLKNMERVAASYIRDLVPEAKIEIKPRGYLGIIIVKIPREDKHKIHLLYQIPELEKIIPIYSISSSNLEKICAEVKRLAKKYLYPNEKFAVRTFRRGNHNFTSIDVNVSAGSCIQEEYGNKVDLTNPDKIFWIEIIDDKAFISVLPKEISYKKKTSDKPNSLRLLKKIAIVQTPYLDEKASYKIGVRIGRTAQSFEIPSLIIAPYDQINAIQLGDFIRGINEGIISRYKLQLKTYNDRKISMTKVYLQDLYHFIRNVNREKEGVIITSTKGKSINQDTKNTIKKLYQQKKKIYVLIGSNQGIPTGLYRLSDILLDVAPYITLATDVAVPSIITALLNIILEK